MTMYHFTCEHRAELIGVDGGVILPYPQQLLGGLSVSWWTTAQQPERAALGLTSHTLSCDRLSARYAALDQSSIMPWAELRDVLPIERVRRLEAVRGTRPSLWHVSLQPITAIRDETRR